MNSYQWGQMFWGKYFLSSPENYFNVCPEYFNYAITRVFRQYRADSNTVRNFHKVHCNAWERPVQNSYSWLSSSFGAKQNLELLQEKWVIPPWGVIISCCLFRKESLVFGGELLHGFTKLKNWRKVWNRCLVWIKVPRF